MIDDLSQKMSNAVGHLEKEFNTIRTSRANPSMLDNIFAHAYGSKTPLNQLGNISTPDPSTITIQVWDTSLLKSIENSILDSGLGINPQIDGQIIRLPIPKLSEERREELTKLAAKYAENSKVVIRNLRRDFLDSQKDLKKNSELSEDDLKKITNDVQKLTDSSIEKIDEILKNISPNKKKMLKLADSGFITATDLADYLVKNHTMSFRKAYQKTAEIVNLAEKKKKKLKDLKIDELKKIEPKLSDEVLKIFDLKNSINSKKSYGGTSFENIKRMILKYKKEK